MSRARISPASIAQLAAPFPLKVARLMMEADLQGQVVDVAQRLGWWCYHPYDSRNSASGWPDLTLLRGHRILYLELKRESGTLTQQQIACHERLRTAGQDVYVMRPSDWPEIIHLLIREA